MQKLNNTVPLQTFCFCWQVTLIAAASVTLTSCTAPARAPQITPTAPPGWTAKESRKYKAAFKQCKELVNAEMLSREQRAEAAEMGSDGEMAGAMLGAMIANADGGERTYKRCMKKAGY